MTVAPCRSMTSKKFFPPWLCGSLVEAKFSMVAACAWSQILFRHHTLAWSGGHVSSGIDRQYCWRNLIRKFTLNVREIGLEKVRKFRTKTTKYEWSRPFWHFQMKTRTLKGSPVHLQKMESSCCGLVARAMQPIWCYPGIGPTTYGNKFDSRFQIFRTSNVQVGSKFWVLNQPTHLGTSWKKMIYLS